MSFEKPFLQRLDSEHRAALDLIPEGLTDFSSIPSARARVDGLMKASAARQQLPEDVEFDDQTIPMNGDRPEILVRLYRPQSVEGPLGAMLFMHGGGFVVGEVAHFDMQCAQLASGAGVLVASVEYRLAPEHPYPTPINDCYAALEWLFSQAAELGVDPNRIGVGGTSAGGALAAGIALMARDRGNYKLGFQLLEAPMLDHRMESESSQSIDHPRVWNTASNRVAWSSYLGDDHLTRNISDYGSPTNATDLSELPPAFISIGSQDIFLDEVIDYARRCIHAGNQVQLNIYEQGFHGSARVIPAAQVSMRWRRDSVEALARLANSTTSSLKIS